MVQPLSAVLFVCLILGLGACKSPSTVSAAPVVDSNQFPVQRQVRATGTVQAVRVTTIQAPQIAGQQGRLTLTKLIPNGATVQLNHVLAEFDRTQQADAAREAEAKYEDFGHQVEQKKAENNAENEKRLSELRTAEADLAKAEIQLRKGPILSEIDRLKNEAKAANATARVASLTKSHKYRSQAAAAALRILELQRDRQKVALERALRNAEKLVLKAAIAGQVAHENIWRGGAMGPPQEGDQLYSGQPLLRIFDPSEMEVHLYVAEPDGEVLVPGGTAVVQLDAYPDTQFPARFESASPVAASAFGSPIKTFAARFRLAVQDPRLMPDLSAAVIVRGEQKQ
ncbi:MAG: HlyD family efflux transporter periplasmic adaptor subunit [Bryobacteraceae bacterium]